MAYLMLKCTIFDFDWGVGGACSAPPDSLAGFDKLTSKGGERRGYRREREGEGERSEGRSLPDQAKVVPAPLAAHWRGKAIACQQ